MHRKLEEYIRDMLHKILRVKLHVSKNIQTEEKIILMKAHNYLISVVTFGKKIEDKLK
jgi:hypothetical protein